MGMKVHTVSPPPTTHHQPGLRSVQHLSRAPDSCETCQAVSSNSSAAPSSLLGTSWRTQQRKGEGVRRVVGLWVFCAVALLRALRAH